MWVFKAYPIMISPLVSLPWGSIPVFLSFFSFLFYFVYVSFISALIFLIPFVLLTLNFVCSFSSCLAISLGCLFEIFLVS